MSSPPASRFSSPEDNAPIDEYEELRERIKSLMGDRTEPDAWVLDETIDFRNAEYRRRRAEEVGRAHRHFGRLSRARFDTGELISLSLDLERSLREDSSIAHINGAYLNILAELEEIEHRTQIVEGVLWMYILKPITQRGAVECDSHSSQTSVAETNNRFAYSISSSHDSQNSSEQAPGQNTSSRSYHSSLAGLHKRFAYLRNPPNARGGKGRRGAAGENPVGIIKRYPNSRSKQAATKRMNSGYRRQSRLSEMTNADDLPHTSEGGSDSFSPEKHTTATAITHTPTTTA
jgi:hypothetical protein